MQSRFYCNITGDTIYTKITEVMTKITENNNISAQVTSFY